MEERGIIEKDFGNGKYLVRFFINPEACSCCAAYHKCIVKKNQQLEIPGPPGLRTGQEIRAVFPEGSKVSRLLIILGSPVAVFLTLFFILKTTQISEAFSLFISSAIAVADFIIMIWIMKKMEKDFIGRIFIEPVR
ncbi:SoxR reducing system RseC family protein [candidate division WOR-3 bacterium]|nr:SoxR reducing system RseC family protein [candidate division WOR-3 bacterium]